MTLKLLWFITHHYESIHPLTEELSVYINGVNLRQQRNTHWAIKPTDSDNWWEYYRRWFWGMWKSRLHTVANERKQMERLQLWHYTNKNRWSKGIGHSFCMFFRAEDTPKIVRLHQARCFWEILTSRLCSTPWCSLSMTIFLNTSKLYLPWWLL